MANTYVNDNYIWKSLYTSDSFYGGGLESGNIGVFGVNDQLGYFTISTVGSSFTYTNIFPSRGTYPAATSNGFMGIAAFSGGSSVDKININTRSSMSGSCELDYSLYGLAAVSNGINDRAVFAGGAGKSPGTYDPYVAQSIMYYTNIQAIDVYYARTFGNLSAPRAGTSGCSNSVLNRGLITGDGGLLSLSLSVGGITIEYITIATPSNSSFFGNRFSGSGILGATSNSVNNRGIFAGGSTGMDELAVSNTIEYVTISTTGNGSYFGNLYVEKAGLSAVSNGTNNRAVFSGGYGYVGYIRSQGDYITITSPSNASLFGDIGFLQSAGTSNA